MPTLAAYRQRLASRLGFYGSATTSELASSTSQLKIAALADTDLQDTHFDGVWFRPTAGTNLGEARRVKRSGYTPGSGTFTTTRGFTHPTAAGVALEFFGVLPPSRELGQDGLLECVNLALAECWLIDTLSMAGVAGQARYPLYTAYPWLDAEDRMVDLFWRRSGATRDELYPEWRFLHDAELPQIELKGEIGPADVLKPRVYRPLNTWIRASSVWAESGTGLVSDSDEALCSLETMEAVGLAHCYRTLAQRATGESQARWRALADEQRVRANNAKKQLPHEDGRSIHWGSASGRAANWPPVLG